MAYLPIVLTGAIPAVVIGGGRVAERKVQGLLQAGATVKVVSPRLTPLLEQLAQEGHIEVAVRCYRTGDLAGARLAIAATSDPAVNGALASEAGERDCLVNVVDDPRSSTFHVPALLRRGRVVIAASTGGASPALARYLRRALEAFVGPEYAQLADILAEARPRLRHDGPDERCARPDWESLFAAALPLLRAGRVQEAQGLVRDLTSGPPQADQP